MRLLPVMLGGLLFGALAGLVWFLLILFMPSDIPNDLDGGGVQLVVLLFIAGLHMVGGGIVGGFGAVILSGVYRIFQSDAPPEVETWDVRSKQGKAVPPYDEDFG
jgi:hypothetical protein